MRITQELASGKMALFRAAIPHARLEVGKIVSPGAPEAGEQIRIRFLGGGRAGKYTR
jgi:hypothetical protein